MSEPDEKLQARGGDMETCGKCMGSGYGGHPDSGALCPDCNGSGVYLDEALAALAKLGAGDGLVERATAALEGVTDGPWAVEYKDGTTRLLMGNEVAMCDEKYYPWTPENDKDWHFIAFTRQWVPEAADRIAALTAQVAELEACLERQVSGHREDLDEIANVSVQRLRRAEAAEAQIAALTAALDPALSERAGEVLSRLRKADEYEPLGHDGWEAADLITALLARIAAMEAQIKGLEGGIEAACNREAETERKLRTALAASETRAEAAEAERDALRGEIAFTATDGQRLLRKIDVIGVCDDPDFCFDSEGSVARCGPCAVKIAARDGVVLNQYTCSNPQAMRLRRELTAAEAQIAALTAAIDPAIAERAGEVLERLQQRDKSRDGYYGHPLFNRDGLQAADLITALLTANAALRAQVRESALQELASLGQAQEVYEAQKAAKAEAVALRAKVARIASAWPIVRDADCSGGTLASAMDEIEAAISDGAADE